MDYKSQHDPGLEVDARQNGLQLNYSELPEKTKFGVNPDTSNADPGFGYQTTPQTARPSKKILGILIPIAVLGWIFAIVAAALAGAMAHQRDNAYDPGLLEHIKSNNEELSSISCPVPTTIPINASTGDSGASKILSNTTAFDSTCFAASNCSALGTTYTSPSNNQQFDIHCGADYSSDTANILAVYTFKFEDCMNACISFNLQPGLNATCDSLSYQASWNPIAESGANGTEGANCFLKKGTNIPQTSNDHVDSAKLLRG
ncbi:hypothetical protein ACLMJK_009123 [Lecanora helva]